MSAYDILMYAYTDCTLVKCHMVEVDETIQIMGLGLVSGLYSLVGKASVLKLLVPKTDFSASR